MELSSSRNAAIERMQSRHLSIDEFNWDRLCCPPLYSLMTQWHINQLYTIATSIKYSGNAEKRYKAFDEVLNPLGFEKCGAGTNRVVYKYLENDTFLLKVAADHTGIEDNPLEFRNQFIYKPFVAKIFEVDPSGVVALVERVVPITNREEFMTAASDIYDVIRNWFLGKYIMADIGTKFFMNWGIRKGFGPVLLDYPYSYELDGNKLFCNNELEDGSRCLGEIDYDDGYNFLWCTKCGKRYMVKQLAKSTEAKHILVKGRVRKMNVVLKRNGVVVNKPNEVDELVKPEQDCIKKPVQSSNVNETGELKIEVKWKPAQKKNNRNNKRRDDLRINNKERRNGANNRGVVRASEGSAEIKQPRNDQSKEIESLKSENKELREEIEDLKRKYDEAKETLDQAYADFDQMESECNEAKKEVESLTAEKNEVLESYDTCEGWYHDEQAKSAKLEEELTDARAENDKLSKGLKAAEDKVKSLEDQMNNDSKSINEDIENYSARVKELEVELDGSNSKLDDMKDLYEKLVIERDELLERLNMNKAKDEKVEADEESKDLKIALPFKPMFPAHDAEYVNYMESEEIPGVNVFAGVLTTINTLNLENGKDLVDKDYYVIAMSAGEDDYLKDQEGNVLCLYKIDSAMVPEVFKNEEVLYKTENQVKLIKSQTN